MQRLALVVLAGLALGCRPEPPAPVYGPYGHAVAPASLPSAVGKASYYADSLAGNATASGEPYDPVGMTAAHRDLPFGTVVDVTRLDNQATVRVRINDRGPFGDARRIIDLSRRAAETLGMIRAGVVDIELRVVSRP